MFVLALTNVIPATLRFVFVAAFTLVFASTEISFDPNALPFIVELIKVFDLELIEPILEIESIEIKIQKIKNIGLWLII